MNIGFISLGCSKNQVDTEIMMGLLKKARHKIVNIPEEAELIIVNTCGFITSAQQEAINTIIKTGELKKIGQLRYLIAAGCLSQRFGQELLDELPELDGVIGISDFLNIVQMIDCVEKGQKVVWVNPPPTTYIEKGPRYLSTPPGYAYLKVAEGCNNHCSYCAIPSIRGRLRSRPVAELIEETEKLAAYGIRELVVIAQDTSAYGTDLNDSSQNLWLLLKGLAKIDGIEWIRLMYLHPNSFDERLIDLLADKSNKIIPYIDIPIQHIADSVLHRMNRRIDGNQIRNLLYNLKNKIPGLVLRTTVMTGFPGETEAEFQQLYDFIAEIEFDWLGAFCFEAQEGTGAYKMGNIPDADVSESRRSAIMKLQKGITRKKNLARINQEEKILVTSRISNNLYMGHGYFQAPEADGITLVKTNKALDYGKLVSVKLKAIRNYDMIGESIE